MRILFLCSGNICRSPFAEVLARQLNDRNDLEFASAGTIALSGNPASATGIAVAAELGVDMSDHRATHLTAEVLAATDLVYAMEEEHVASVLALDPGARVELLSRNGEPMPDPYGGDRIEYLASYSLIAVALEDRLTDGDERPG
ncbi:MAG: low molecular weight phosphotyrosine protein phosphatase [Acidimicrobiia bacterium]|nr:low molecular weight phosphotyrosine protein phosphatase [Acidimicrobiia bacterium]MBT8193279.1 low molecular weight phosphotyrosine protein phosphatase [Acidimicrobiia bacterium]MBT8247929.1 low molecular weight phosphotyrosine protein phosphatase [Acidimicrobiia bacterium]NNF87126.1 low molecular weight phosphotyrosine protein phosphatase [Acidimicrobiia bacterium]NNJ47792.1 low molecular weight phosphotyrosine protein phosphatase [Acidimicrobiia bacterium]